MQNPTWPQFPFQAWLLGLRQQVWWFLFESNNKKLECICHHLQKWWGLSTGDVHERYEWCTETIPKLSSLPVPRPLCSPFPHLLGHTAGFSRGINKHNMSGNLKNVGIMSLMSLLLLLEPSYYVEKPGLACQRCGVQPTACTNRTESRHLVPPSRRLASGWLQPHGYP